MRGMPYNMAFLYEQRLWRLVLYAETLFDGIRYFAVFNDPHRAADQPARLREFRKLFIGLGADRTLRAMLENNDRIALGPA